MSNALHSFSTLIIINNLLWIHNTGVCVYFTFKTHLYIQVCLAICTHIRRLWQVSAQRSPDIVTPRGRMWRTARDWESRPLSTKEKMWVHFGDHEVAVLHTCHTTFTEKAPRTHQLKWCQSHQPRCGLTHWTPTLQGLDFHWRLWHWGGWPRTTRTIGVCWTTCRADPEMYHTYHASGGSGAIRVIWRLGWSQCQGGANTIARQIGKDEPMGRGPGLTASYQTGLLTSKPHQEPEVSRSWTLHTQMANPNMEPLPPSQKR